MKHLLCAFLLVISVMPSFAQHFSRPEYRIFAYSSFNNANKKFSMTGVWNTERIADFSIMCIKRDAYAKDYFFICNESQCNTWIKSLVGIRDLFAKNDSIAKANGVTSDISKNISDKFTFAGLYGEGDMNHGPITKNYNGRGFAADIRVLYLYKNGHSSMELYLWDYHLNSAKKVWTFDSVESFEDMINALKWSSFEAALNTQIREYTEQQRAANAAKEKQNKESQLFD